MPKSLQAELRFETKFHVCLVLFRWQQGENCCLLCIILTHDNIKSLLIWQSQEYFDQSPGSDSVQPVNLVGAWVQSKCNRFCKCPAVVL